MGILASIAAKYGLQILGVLALIGVIVGGYFYIKHTGATEQHEKDMRELNERNQIEQKQADKLLADTRAENAAIKAKNDEIYIGVLTNASQTIKTTQFERDAAISELRKLRQRTTAAQSNNSASSGKTGISEGGIGGTGVTCDEISTAEIDERLGISRLADLALLASGFIRQVADVK
jgi:hypothetical protein